MACLGCGRSTDNNNAYQMKIGNFTYELCDGCFKISGAVEGCKRIKTDNGKHNCRYKKILKVALTIVEGQEKNETLWIETTNPGETVLQRELRWLHDVIKKQPR